MLGNLGMSELIVILIIALIIFGPGKLPEVGKAIGRGVRNFKKAISGDSENEPDKSVPESNKELKG